MNKLYRARKDRILGGVCGGLGAYFGVDPVLVRLLFVVLAVWGGAGVPIYIILWIIMPPEERVGVASQDVISANVTEIESEAKRFAAEARSAFSGEGAPKERTMWAAAALIAVGALLLLGNLTGYAFHQLWPVVLILVGGYMVYQAVVRR